jgi:uncharacterized protein YbbC (DUF1343 family)
MVSREHVLTGLEQLVQSPPRRFQRARIGLLANQASVGLSFDHAASLIDRALPGCLKVMLGPQHGFAGEKQDNMVESDHGIEKTTQRPVYSLYGQTRRPTEDMLRGLDVLFIDLVDVGTRVYTFAQTVSYCLEEAAALGVEVVILDRPNPIGGREVEGNLLKPEWTSFVGRFPIPMRHGLTLGELSMYMADQVEGVPEPEVVRLKGWRRGMYFDDTGLNWVYPSPNMPTPETAWLYPGQVLWEGTNVSEGRGTTRPFHLCGAPFIDPMELKAAMDAEKLPGVVFRPALFEPMFHKYAGQVCGGLEIHPTDKRTYRPYLTSLTMLAWILGRHPDEFRWKEPPYEYEYDRRPIDLILGDAALRQKLESGASSFELEAAWQPDLEQYLVERSAYLLYEDQKMICK